MSLSDCPKCWDALCTCGYQYRNWSKEHIQELIDVLENLKVDGYKEQVLSEQEKKNLINKYF